MMKTHWLHSLKWYRIETVGQGMEGQRALLFPVFIILPSSFCFPMRKVCRFQITERKSLLLRPFLIQSTKTNSFKLNSTRHRFSRPFFFEKVVSAFNSDSRGDRDSARR